MEKIKKAKFPTSKKEMLSFIGLVNSIRRVVPFEVIKQIQILTPLTSSSKLVNFDPQKQHFEAFEVIKSMLLKEPLFCNLIKPNSTKYLWVDVATSSNCLGAVLAQRIDRNDKGKYLPPSIDLDDKVQRIIYDRCFIQQSFPLKIFKIKDVKTLPPVSPKSDRLMSFTEKTYRDSIFWSVVSIFSMYCMAAKFQNQSPI